MAISNPTEALRIVFACAALYEKNLSGNNVLFATVENGESAYVETLFQSQNFLHLTGLRTNLSSERFYDAALHQRLKLSDVSFKKSGVTELKLQVLPKLMAIHTTARMIGDYDHSQPLLITDKFAGTVAMAIGFVYANGIYVPNTALKMDIRDISQKETRRKIVAIFVKPRNNIRYKRLSYIAKGLTIDDDALASVLREKVDIAGPIADFPIPRNLAK